ncbi:MAG TPA: cytochrome b5-like heme/steroid binding domain-containing protein [Candidatus Paceibacterota bacterium]|jgi:cytochrome b involved in lipid metabolism|nr:cytochrome b5-like heme/steroid binding domain-containing protein [Candidatus Paceibacterota bacterium]
MSIKLLVVVGLIAVVVLGAAFFLNTPPVPAINNPGSSVDETASATASSSVSTKTPDTTPAPVTTPAPTPVPAPSGYTLAQVSAHNSSASCWTAINAKVYDVTSWISQHPGGAGAILSLCGKDGSAAFNGQHGGERRPEAELATFYLAPLI